MEDAAECGQRADLKQSFFYQKIRFVATEASLWKIRIRKL